MKEVHEGKNELEKAVSKSPEKKLTSVNDLRIETDKESRMESINDLRKETKGTEKKMKSVDDMRRSSEGSALRKWEKENPELAEKRHLDSASEQIKKEELMQPEKWRSLNDTQKKVALDRAGRMLSKAYDHPNPPLFVKDIDDKYTLGGYGNGFRFEPSTGKIVGVDYGIELNRKGEIDKTNRKLFGNDPKEALRAYAHEFRHSYQCEQATRYNKPQFINLVDNPEKAKEWSENLKNYKDPPEKELFNRNPNEYRKKFKEYENQSIEKDTNNFENELIKRIFG